MEAIRMTIEGFETGVMPAHADLVATLASRGEGQSKWSAAFTSRIPQYAEDLAEQLERPEVIKEFLEVRKKYPNSYAMYHARFATHGVKNDDNCHPFKVGGSELTYLAHNGILSVDIPANDMRSDTRIFAEDILPSMGGVTALDNTNLYRMIEGWASGSKIAVFTLDPNAEYDCYIINEDLGHWDNAGNWWSNDGYKESTWTNLWRQYDTTDFTDDGEYSCIVCAEDVDMTYNPYYCHNCGACFDCSMIVNDTCLCWSPEKDEWSSGQHKQMTGAYNGQYDFGF
jgi:glutamine amidotransferase